MPDTTDDQTVIDALRDRIAPLDADAQAAADERQGQLIKPPGSMGRLETLGTHLAGITGACPPPIPTAPVLVVAAGDHGVVAQGVSMWPQEVTAQMVAGVAAGMAVVSALARQTGVRVEVVDVGVASELPPGLPVTDRRIAAGTADLSQGPAMTRAEAERAIAAGAAFAEELIDGGADLLLTGDLGIGNTTASAALVSAFTGRPAHEVTGAGAGADAPGLQRKVSVVDAAVRRLGADHPHADALDTLAALGGLEHAFLVGVILASAARRVPVVLDGVIAGSTALAARAIAPGCAAYLVAGHRSAEPGATAALSALGLPPLVDLGLRLGEGSGAVLAVPFVQAAARLLTEVATFAEAAVSGSAHDG